MTPSFHTFRLSDTIWLSRYVYFSTCS